MEALLSVDVATLPKPRASRNVIYEDRRRVKSVVSRRVHQEDIVNSVNSVITLQRGYHNSVPSKHTIQYHLRGQPINTPGCGQLALDSILRFAQIR